MVSREFLVLGVDLVESFLVDQEISVDGNGHHHRAIVEDLQLDILGLGSDAVVPDIDPLAVSQLLGAGLGRILGCRVVG